MNFLPQLIPDWKQSWRYYSMHTSGIGFLLTLVAGSLALSGAAASWITVFHLGVVIIIAAIIFVANMIGRIILQKGKTNDKQENKGQ